MLPGRLSTEELFSKLKGVSRFIVLQPHGNATYSCKIDRNSTGTRLGFLSCRFEDWHGEEAGFGDLNPSSEEKINFMWVVPKVRV